MSDTDRFAKTGEWQVGDTERIAPETAVAIPTKVGRYRIERVLGAGGFGMVYLATDEQLGRKVAVKIPHRHLLEAGGNTADHLREAVTVANLDHPHIVPVHDVGSTDEFPCFVVSKYIDGVDLAEAMQRQPLNTLATAKLVATVAEALHFAHTHGFVHRDIKPGNVLLARDGTPYLVDFGLARSEDELGNGSRFVGTPAYSSPEQARGEGHRLDGRSDIFSLGIVFYELLTGRRPFRGDTNRDTLLSIIKTEPRPLRQINDAIPRELERICLKALAKRVAERYLTAQDFADDLRDYVASAERSAEAASPSTTGAFEVHGAASDGSPRESSVPNSSEHSINSREIRIVPKGLRSFDQYDADFFLDLLPGPRDRHGLPDSLRFWKCHIEELEADRTFPIGLLYGPSGCGKSSLVKAGLIPQLSKKVTTIYLEATSGDTETTLVTQIQKHFPQVPKELSLRDAVAFLRRRDLLAPRQKVLIIIDQLEQWLHAHRQFDDAELVDALRQCDGGRVQCLLLVRDDFWMAVTRFMQALEVRLSEGRNSAAADLFDTSHARRVLIAFGRAFGDLPHDPNPLTKPQRDFVKQAVESLAEDGKVICARLALFAEILKNRPWLPSTLKQLGGVAGVGVAFLEESFHGKSAPPAYRLHQSAVCRVLTTLLPEAGSEIRGHRQSESVLRTASGYAHQPREFQSLLEILNDDVRLLTPSDPPDHASVPAEEKYYQLTHDYLVPSIRVWLARRHRSSRRGRAELLLTERSNLWAARAENRLLPTPWEAARILLLTQRGHWSTSQQAMMRAAGRYYASRAGVALLLLLVAASFAWNARRQWINRRHAEQTQQFVDQLLVANAERLPEIIQQLEIRGDHWQDHVQSVAHDATRPASERFRAMLAVWPRDATAAPLLRKALTEVNLSEYLVAVDRLGTSTSEIIPQLWQDFEDEDARHDKLLRVAGVLARYNATNPRWKSRQDAVAEALVQVDPSRVNLWVDLLRPVKATLWAPLLSRYQDRSSPAQENILAASVLVQFADHDTTVLADLIVSAHAGQFPLVLEALRHDQAAARESMRRRLESTLTAVELSNNSLAVQHRANTLLALAHLGDPQPLWAGLELNPHPSLRTRLIDSLADARLSPQLLLDQIATEGRASVRQALLLALGTYRATTLSSPERARIVDTASVRVAMDADAGVHSAARWLLARIGKPLPVASPASEFSRERAWWTTSAGHTMAVIDQSLSFTMGSPESEADRDPIEPRQQVTIPRPFALGTHEVTIEQFQRFQPDVSYSPIIGPDVQCPVNRVSWYDAVRYCRWLSEREGIDESQMCYPSLAEISPTMRLPDDLLARTGYRLPTEAEWECACRAGTESRWFFGDDDTRLADYGWYLGNSQERTWPVGSLRPNPWGLFDVHGNVGEWCHDVYGPDIPGYVETTSMVGDDVVPGQTMFRGGTYRSATRLVRTSKRYSYPPDSVFSILGFRLARTLPQQTD